MCLENQNSILRTWAVERYANLHRVYLERTNGPNLDPFVKWWKSPRCSDYHSQSYPEMLANIHQHHRLGLRYLDRSKYI